MSGNEGETAENAYQKIRYSRLYFTLRFPEKTSLVREKASALRGGIGEMLLRAHCIADRDCEACGFAKECVVQRIFYAQVENAPVYMQTGSSVGYVVSCADKQREFAAGDTLEFCMTLFGKTIVYFSEILTAVYALGQAGLGQNKSRYEILSVKNLYRQEIMNGNNIIMGNYRWQTLGDHIAWRKQRMESGDAWRIRFDSPVSIKYQGKFLQEMTKDALAESLWRRIYILSLFEGISCERHCPYEELFPQIISQHMHISEVPRHSSRRDQFMKLRGLKGEVLLRALPDPWLDLLLAGEITHLGKNTSFGFGGYRVLPAEREEYEKKETPTAQSELPDV